MLLPLIMRTRFRLTARERANRTIEREGQLSAELARSVSAEQAAQNVEVPAMIGVDPEMRHWSLLQTLEHNVIVNRSITGIVTTLAAETPYVSSMDPKHDVLPGDSPGIDQIEAFEQSVCDHLETVSRIGSLRSKQRFDHPLSGSFDAHAWHCMFGFHLWLHRRQMQKAVEQL